MKITLIFTGKTKIDYLETGITEYLKRLKHYANVEVKIIPDKVSSKISDVQKIKMAEGEAIAKVVKPSDFLVLLDEQGQEFTSIKLSNQLKKLNDIGKNAVMVIGGAYGFSNQLYERANAKWALSQLTFTHQMVRLILVEQVYRAFTIMKGEKYHHV